MITNLSNILTSESQFAICLICDKKFSPHKSASTNTLCAICAERIERGTTLCGWEIRGDEDGGVEDEEVFAYD